MALKLVVLILTVSIGKSVRCEEGNVVINQIVHTDSGPVRGKLDETILQKTNYYSFKGIPYAEVPVGDLRFKVSQIVRIDVGVCVRRDAHCA